MLALASALVVATAAADFVYYALRPTWPLPHSGAAPPAIPVTVAGVLFEIPRGAFRFAGQRQPGPHPRIDLAFPWPSLKPQTNDDLDSLASVDPAATITSTTATTRLSITGASSKSRPNARLFVTIAPLGAALAPRVRLHDIYPRYLGAQHAEDGPAGLAILPFRKGTRYAGQDLVYAANDADRFFALCTRPTALLPGACVHEHVLDAVEVSFRFQRRWLQDWRGLSTGIHRLLTRLHP
jgi:hypothetical protein